MTTDYLDCVKGMANNDLNPTGNGSGYKLAHVFGEVNGVFDKRGGVKGSRL
jgi:hypothetical protein